MIPGYHRGSFFELDFNLIILYLWYKTKNQGLLKPNAGNRKPPFAFTEQGVAMLSSALKSKKAIEINIAIMRTFVMLRKMFYENREALNRLDDFEFLIFNFEFFLYADSFFASTAE